MNPIPARPTVVVLGGAGGMGRYAVSLAAKISSLGELVVADLDLAAAEKVVGEIAPTANAPLRAVRADVTDEAALHALLEGADVVLNTTGPFYRLGVGVLRTAIRAHCRYLDICDDPEPTLDLLALNDEAAAHGVIAIVGLGASPGASNLLAKLACERLDDVDDLYTAWSVDHGEDAALDEAAEDMGGTSAAMIHWMQQISGTIEVIEAGVRVARAPLARVELDYPGAGRGTGYTLGHPEPITLHDRMRVRGNSANLMLLKPTTAAFLEGLGRDIDAGNLTLEAAAAEILAPGLKRSAKSFVRAASLSGGGALPPFFAWARGKRGGKSLNVGVHLTALPGGMDRVTSTPLVLGLRQLLEARIDATGVHPPESVVDPESFFDGLAQACDPPLPGMNEFVVVVEAPSAGA